MENRSVGRELGLGLYHQGYGFIDIMNNFKMLADMSDDIKGVSDGE